MGLRHIIISLLLLFTGFTAFAEPAAPSAHFDANTYYQQMITTGDKLIQEYDPAQGNRTMQGFVKWYFDLYEGSGFEMSVRRVSENINTQTESLVTQIIGQSGQGASSDALKRSWAALKIRLQGDRDLIQSHGESSFWQTFLEAFLILLREGFEALIIVTALLAYLNRAHGNKYNTVIYGGVSTALVASLGTAYLFNHALQHAGANREALEGITMLVAAGVLFYVSYWLFSKRETHRWQTYLKDKVTTAVTKGSLFALGLAAFLAVYREGAETILFYQAMALGSGGQTLPLALGIAAATIALGFLYYGMRTAAFKIPFKLFFSATAVFLFYMAFSFIGGGFLELQEAGWVGITPLLWLPRLPWLGIYPTLQSTGAQVLFLLPSLGALWWHRRRSIIQREQRWVANSP